MHSNEKELQAVMQENDLIVYAYSRFLNHMPDFISPEMVTGLVNDCNISDEEALLTLFSAACGLEPDRMPSHRRLEENYLRRGVHRLEPALYQNDPYYRQIRFPQVKRGSWEMRKRSYAPYELFVCNHPTLTEKYCEIPQLGYFTESFCFPAVLENGIEWMTVTPNEIETMREPIKKSHGRVLTLGLGLGYFAFCASEKAEVESVTVVERNPDVIALFREQLLPQFPHADKIEVVEADAFAFLNAPDIATRFDYVFADLWHDQSDGLPMYLKLRRIERDRKLAEMDYWIEPTLLSSLRRMVYDKLTDEQEPLRLEGVSMTEFLSNEFLRRLAPDVKAFEE